MLEKEFYVIAFESTHHALKVESMLKNEFKIEMIPTPREISASCGLSIKFLENIFKDVVKYVKDDVKNVNIYKVKKIGRTKEVNRMDL
ncbi:DUF3343 domain-containing protein [Lutibacter sp. B2]|nr:DUF3343 domain-containing protein [Lutibacter sp. B2]